MQENDDLAPYQWQTLVLYCNIVWQPSFSFESPDSKYCSGITSPIFSVLGKKGQHQPRPTQGPVLAEIGPFVPTKPSHWGGTLFSVPPLLLTVLIKKIPALMNYYQGSQHTIGRGCLLMDFRQCGWWYWKKVQKSPIMAAAERILPYMLLATACL